MCMCEREKRTEKDLFTYISYLLQEDGLCGKANDL